MFFPEFKFIDITSSVTDFSGLRDAIDENKLTIAIQPEKPNNHAIVGLCMVCDVSGRTGAITVEELKETVGKLIVNLNQDISESIEMSGYSVPLPPPPSMFLFKTRADKEDAQARVFSHDILPALVEMECAVIGTDHSRFGEVSENDMLLKQFKENNITSLINLDLREIASGEQGTLIVSPLKTIDPQPVPARTIIMQR